MPLKSQAHGYVASLSLWDRTIQLHQRAAFGGSITNTFKWASWYLNGMRAFKWASWYLNGMRACKTYTICLNQSLSN